MVLGVVEERGRWWWVWSVQVYNELVGVVSEGWEVVMGVVNVCREVVVGVIGWRERLCWMWLVQGIGRCVGCG